MASKPPKYPGIRVTTNGNQLIATYTEPLMAEAGVFYPITPSTEQGENFQLQYAQGTLNAFGDSFIAIEAEGEHAAQGGAIAVSITGKRTVNFTSGQGIVYGLEQYYHAPGKLTTMVLEVGARALTKHALNVHCGHDDIYAAFDTTWTMLFGKDAQQTADQAIILRRVTELSLNPGMNIQDGFLTTHMERTFVRPEPELIREYLGRSDDEIECPTAAQKELFGETRRRVPKVIDLQNPQLIGPVQNQEHYMNGCAARRNHFTEDILGFLEEAYADFGELTGRHYGLISEYKCDDAQTVFVALGSAAENIEAAVDALRDEGEKVGVIHLNVLRPFPEAAIAKALKGKKNIIVLERTDESMSGDNPLTREIRATLSKAVSNFRTLSHAHIPVSIDPASELPDLFSGVYGLGSRDFRPEGIFGAYEYATGKIARQDGKKSSDGERFFYVGINHPYAVLSKKTPSLLPDGAIAVRLHSIGGWGMITTGKNLGEILGTFSNFVARRDNITDENGDYKEVVDIAANAKYGSEKKGAPTNYFLVAAPERIRMNCDLLHVNVVLCCDPKIFLHDNPLVGLSEGGAFVWESSETTSETVWQRIPPKYRQEIIDKKIRVFALPGFDIAKAATNRPDLQTRMQGNSFLGGFFKVSSFLQDYSIGTEDFERTVKEQYTKKFGRFGDSVVESNMTVMRQGFEQIFEVTHGTADALNTSSFSSPSICPTNLDLEAIPASRVKSPMNTKEYFYSEYKGDYGYDQPASPLASVGVMAAATGSDSSKYVARREVPIWIAENCTQCMDCIITCPDTALPNTAQDINTVLATAIRSYVSDDSARAALMKAVPTISENARGRMIEIIAEKGDTAFSDIVANELDNVASTDSAISSAAIDEVKAIMSKVPMAYQRTMGVFSLLEKKKPGSGGLFAITVADLCKGCSACVDACDDDALRMVTEDDDLHADMESNTSFIDLLHDTPQKYLGKFDASNPAEARAATLRYHLMVQSKYKSLVSGDGACAGCGEKSVLRGLATLTETLMRPVFHNKAERLLAKADKLASTGLATLTELKKKDETAYTVYRRSILHLIMGFGGTDLADTEARITAEFSGDDAEIINALVVVLKQDAHNHRDLQTIEGSMANGQCVMAMAAHTGCNTVFGSTPPNNPHPYPWMNSLFQDGATIGWLIGESFIQDHGQRSVIPERLADAALDAFADGYTEAMYYDFSHFTDNFMTDSEIMELPKVWVVGGDGGMGDIGFQNVSKAILQNRPNVKMLMLNTQVYSNTGGQNSESSVMTGGFDMNQAGPATEGKMSEMKSVVESFLGGHGSPFLAQVSMANSANMYKAMIDAICYRGSCFIQAFTTCQPEHGVADDASQRQALAARDSRCVPEFVSNPNLGEMLQENFSLKGNGNVKNDWVQKRIPGSKVKYNYTIANWAFTEARFRLHHKIIKDGNLDGMVFLDDILKNVTSADTRYRYHLIEGHRAFIPKTGVYATEYKEDGTPIHHAISRQMVVFCIERRRNWRMLQSRLGIVNLDYEAQKEHIAALEAAQETAAT